ncbi:TetR family transcriptional regulator [Streptomyces omiyaensis]|uniref:TetR family transcriptional regulator n=1 Tax=Streptomyces omiyaensis TaxID=68247 RepID=A0ABW7BNS9_9ACTN|nr:TetR family transcriptional regulator [Streptomyces omiyaensis]GGY31670.1 TetR family transcriptional regulator [Streptomyces omiyaensis]
MAATETLTAERILEATEEVLRRYGPAKATVVDVARVLGVSHGSVYRHFRTKAALREAVTERWLERNVVELRPYAEGRGPADERLGGWLRHLFAMKRQKAGGDPELMATYMVLIGENSAVVDRHVDHLVEQIAAIVADGIRDGAFAAADPDVATTARAVFDATDRFHDPAHAADWSAPGIEPAFEAVLSLVLRALRRA